MENRSVSPAQRSPKISLLHRLGLGATLALVAGMAAAEPSTPGPAAPGPAAATPQCNLIKTPAAGHLREQAAATARQYVETFYPLWFTYYQSLAAAPNVIVGPERVTALYQIVVAINVDTLYASTFLDLTTQPVVLKIPQKTGAYSVLVLDHYGNVVHTPVPSQPAGTLLPAAEYAIYGPDYQGTVPAGLVPVPMPYNHMVMIFRADKYSPEGVDQQAEGEAFRTSLFTQPLCAYLGEACSADVPSGGPGTILPEAYFALPFKSYADWVIEEKPFLFLRELRLAVNSEKTPPLSAQDQALVASFENLFADGSPQDKIKSSLAEGAQSAHKRLNRNYRENLGPNNWIHFTNIGHWGENVLDRASITEYIQFGNDIDAAAYYHTFKSGGGEKLKGKNSRHGYVLTFPPGGQPDAARFWSVTAYTPKAIELIPNAHHKYGVARYTPGLETNADGSVSIYMTKKQPEGVAFANWLPIPDGEFNIMLRVYGPQGTVADNTYVPPAIRKIRKD